MELFFEDDFSAQIVNEWKVNEWIKTNMQLRATSRESQVPNMGRRVTWNRQPQTAVCRLL